MKKCYFAGRVFTIAIVGTLLISMSVIPVQADDLHQQLNQYQQQVNQLNASLNVQKQNVAAATTQVSALRQSIQVLNSSIAMEQTKLNEEQRHLKELEDQQQKLEAQRQEHIQALGQYLKNNYEDGVTTYLAVLFEATSLSDFLDRVDKVHAIMGTYGKLQNDIKTLSENINTQKSAIQQKQDSIQSVIQEKAQTQQAVQQVLNKQETILAQLSAEEKATLNASLNAQAKVSRVQKLIQQEELEASLAAKGGSPDGSNASGGVAGTVNVSGGAQQIINYGAQFLGTPYVWGGTTPSPGFDCSGYVQYVFRHFGISLYRTSEQQFQEGIPEARSDLKPGDLVFFHTYAQDASHVGIYVGNNTMLNSSADGVSYDDMTNSYWAPRYLGARRVIAP